MWSHMRWTKLVSHFWDPCTLPETNVAPENRSSQKQTHVPTPVFQVRAVSFREGRSIWIHLGGGDSTPTSCAFATLALWHSAFPGHSKLGSQGKFDDGKKKIRLSPLGISSTVWIYYVSVFLLNSIVDFSGSILCDYIYMTIYKSFLLKSRVCTYYSRAFDPKSNAERQTDPRMVPPKEKGGPWAPKKKHIFLFLWKVTLGPSRC